METLTPSPSPHLRPPFCPAVVAPVEKPRGGAPCINRARFRLSVSIGREQAVVRQDLDIIFDSCLKFDQHIHEKIYKAYGILGLIKRNFEDLSTRELSSIYIKQ
jgi:hypothetical protein